MGTRSTGPASPVVVRVATWAAARASGLARALPGVARWVWVTRRWALPLLVAAGLAGLVGWPRVEWPAVGLAVVPAVVATVWGRLSPLTFERCCAGPLRRFGWRRWVRRTWPSLARECGLSVQRKTTRRAWALQPAKASGLGVSSASTVTTWVHPRLMDVLTSGNGLRLLVRARVGQTVDDLEGAAPAFAAAAGAVSHRVRVLSPSVIEVVLVMRETLATSTTATLPQNNPAEVIDGVVMGRRQDGTPWRLIVRGRHTLVVGASGSGKGSMLWGLCAGLAPAVSADLVRLWGVDLKKGVEVAMGGSLFTATAYERETALSVLARLVEVIDTRGRVMRGVSRLHTPRPGDPLHVLVIDELADLTAYGEPETRREANRLLAIIQSQGRALGVVVLACVQDPRKEVVPTRGLFTQTVALRLRTASETVMVLGDGMAPLAPAHRINPGAPGTAYVVDEDGTVDRVRADYWPDDLVRQVAATHPTPVHEPVEVPDTGHGHPGQAPYDTQPGSSWPVTDLPTGRKPRTPRTRRGTRQRAARTRESGGEVA